MTTLYNPLLNGFHPDPSGAYALHGRVAMLRWISEGNDD